MELRILLLIRTAQPRNLEATALQLQFQYACRTEVALVLKGDIMGKITRVIDLETATSQTACFVTTG
jgi:hypothetical protein